MAKTKRSKRSRKSSSDSSSGSSSDSDSSSKSNSSSKSSFSDVEDAKVKKFVFKKRESGRLAKWLLKGIPEKHVKAAREAFKPTVEKMDKKFDASNIFTNPRLDGTLFTALQTVKNSTASVSNIDPQEKIYRRQTDLVLDIGKPLLFLVQSSKFKKKSSNALALKTMAMLWAHLVKDISSARRLNIMTQVHRNHVDLLNRSAELLPVGGEDLFGDAFVKELVAQVQTAALVRNSIAGPSATSTPKSGTGDNNNRPPPPLTGPGTSANSSHQGDGYVLSNRIYFIPCCLGPLLFLSCYCLLS
jgi:hypothetical protein